MKRVAPTLLAVISFLSLASFDAGAEDGEFSRKPIVSVGWGGIPTVDRLFLEEYNIYTYYNPVDLDNIYQRSYGTKYITSLISVTCDIPVNSKISIPIVAGFDIGWRPYTDYATNTDGTEYSACFKILAGERWNYFQRPHFGLYLSCLFGLEIPEIPYDELFLAAQFVPFGMSFGGRIFGFAEIGLGTMYAGGMFGVGYKF